MKTFSTLVIVTFSVICLAQVPDTTFQKVFFTYEGPYMARTLASAPEDGALILGDREYGFSSLTRVDSAGTQLWTVTYSSDEAGMSSNIQFRDMIQTYDSSYVSVGYVTLPQTSFSHMVIMKTDLNGDTLWTAQFNKSTETSITGTAIHEGIDSSLLICGYGLQNNKAYLIKLDSTGNLVWERELEDVGSIEPYGLTQSADGIIHLVGIRYPGSANQSAFIVSFDEGGNFLSGQSVMDVNLVDIIDHNGDLYLLGSHGNYVSIFKMEYNGGIVWKKSYYYTSLLDYSRKAYLRPLSNGNLALMYGDRWFTTHLMIIDTEGNILEQQSHMWGGIDLLETHKKGLFTVGYGPLYGVKMLNHDHTGIARMDSLYNNSGMCAWETMYSPFEPNVQFVPLTITTVSALVRSQLELYYFQDELNEQLGCVETWGGLSEKERELSISISPNPSNGLITLEQVDNIPFAMKIMDVSGRPILEAPEFKTMRKIDMTPFGTGLYLYTVTFHNGSISSGRFIID